MRVSVYIGGDNGVRCLQRIRFFLISEEEAKRFHCSFVTCAFRLGSGRWGQFFATECNTHFFSKTSATFIVGQKLLGVYGGVYSRGLRLRRPIPDRFLLDIIEFSWDLLE